MKLLVLVVLALALSACCSVPSVTQTPSRPRPVESMEPCVPLKVPQTGTAAELAQELQDAAQQYAAACQRAANLVEWIGREQ